ncbi:ATP synthase subunit s, mitochondrial isoform X2 [Nymphalis io]|uniref:ATP synthase subunit s, mitochondrial isoform X2 n=1 Tax=Inachis io TaxID=171585 RepID=UPI0021699D21|nr:ATP synthase subunit s, mitochondrial isoform X2 [Nymphalis io]
MYKLRPVINNLHDNFRRKAIPVRSFWEYVNMMFNKPDPERIKTLGPDRACAEWVLRNGGKIIWSDGKKLEDYNSLPPEEQSVPKIVAIDGSDSSISHYGFPHLSGCTMLEKIILHNNKYIDDRAMKGLAYGDATLKYAQVSECVNVTDIGLKEIRVLTKLNTLVLFKLSSVNNLDDCKQYLQSQLPSCKILGKYVK